MNIAFAGNRYPRRGWVRALQALGRLLALAGFSLRVTNMGGSDGIFDNVFPASRVTRVLPFARFGQGRIHPSNRVEVAWRPTLAEEAAAHWEGELPPTTQQLRFGAANVLALQGAEALVVLPDRHRLTASLDDHAIRVAKARGVRVVDLARGDGLEWLVEVARERCRTAVGENLLLAEYLWCRRAAGCIDRESWRSDLGVVLRVTAWLLHRGRMDRLLPLRQATPEALIWSCFRPHGTIRFPEDPIDLAVYRMPPANRQAPSQPRSDQEEVFSPEEISGDPGIDRDLHLESLGGADRLWWESCLVAGDTILQEDVPSRWQDPYRGVLGRLAWGCFHRPLPKSGESVPESEAIPIGVVQALRAFRNAVLAAGFNVSAAHAVVTEILAASRPREALESWTRYVSGLAESLSPEAVEAAEPLAAEGEAPYGAPPEEPMPALSPSRWRPVGRLRHEEPGFPGSKEFAEALKELRGIRDPERLVGFSTSGPWPRKATRCLKQLVADRRRWLARYKRKACPEPVSF